jgi:hypothetical protein
MKRTSLPLLRQLLAGAAMRRSWRTRSDAIVVKADDVNERVIMELPRSVLEDHFQLRSTTPQERLARRRGGNR